MTTTELPRPGDQETSETRGQGDGETRSKADPLLVTLSPGLPVSGSPLLPVTLSPLQVALGYLGVLSVAEVLTALLAPQGGLALYGILLVILLLHTALTWEHPSHGLLLSLTFAPLIRLLSLSLPLAGLPLLYWYFIISVPLVVAAVIALRTLGFSWTRVGLNLRALPIQFLVGLTGLAFGYIEYQILRPGPLAKALTWEQLWIPVLILLVSTGFVEELIFRGVMQQAATEALGRYGILYVAVLFAVLHVGYKSLLDVLFVFGVALFFGWVVARTSSILGVTLSHGLTNIVLFLVVPLSPMFNPPVAPLVPGTLLPFLATPTLAVTATVTPAIGSAVTPTASELAPATSPTPSAMPTLTPMATAIPSPIAVPPTPALVPSAIVAVAHLRTRRSRHRLPGPDHGGGRPGVRHRGAGCCWRLMSNKKAVHPFGCTARIRISQTKINAIP
ncbi:MAG: CPBP family glutamic-type intramembrane protease [Anaerolineae bacterium]